MNNIHLLPTVKPSRVFYDISLDKLVLASTYEISKWFENKHIYITSDEEIKEKDWCYYENGDLKGVHKVVNGQRPKTMILKKIILTTDQDLIDNGVQAIDDEFLEWFVKNPSCEEVDFYIEKYVNLTSEPKPIYKITIPQEEPKSELPSKLKTVLDNMTQEEFDKEWEKVVDLGMESPSISEKPKEETVEEAAEKLFPINSTGSCMEMLNKHQLYNSYKQEGFIEGAKWQAERMYSEEDVINALHSVELKHNKNYSKIYEGMKQWFEQHKKK